MRIKLREILLPLVLNLCFRKKVILAIINYNLFLRVNPLNKVRMKTWKLIKKKTSFKITKLKKLVKKVCVKFYELVVLLNIIALFSFISKLKPLN